MRFDNYMLRPLQLADAPQLLQLIAANRKRINNYLPKTAQAVYDKSSAKNYIREKLKNEKEKREFCFLIIDQDKQEPCGAVFLKNFEWSVPKCELGYFIDKEYEGRGVTSGAIKVIISYCFEVLLLNKLFLRSATDNEGSKRVAEKNGFIEEGVLRKDFMTLKGELIDVMYYGLVKPGLSL
ncbi:MAG: N-acetyltransferase [Bacteroidetes bacterium]|nr:N-acetyltransferase [Bacteroidota bacterium]